MSTPDDLEHEFTLLTAAVRYNELRVRDALAPPTELDPQETPLSRQEALELLALGEVLVRKTGYGRQLGVRTARAAGASWSQIGAALGTSKQAAWEARTRWIDDRAEQNRRNGYGNDLDGNDIAADRARAGEPDE